MTSFVLGLLATLIASSVDLQTRNEATASNAFYAVSYVEVAPSSRTAAIAALNRYRDGTRTEDGHVRFELFEQVGRPGHFAVVETWRDRSGFDARSAVVQKQLQDMLQPLRVSGYDQRPYKTLAVGATGGAPNGRAIVVIAHVDVSPDPRVPAMLKGLADASRQDRGNLRFDVLQHTMRANHFTVIEAWQSQSALEAHAAAAHTRQYRDELQPMTGSPLDERVYMAVE
jgi:quinol monooxygenase YgiN